MSIDQEPLIERLLREHTRQALYRREPRFARAAAAALDAGGASRVLSLFDTDPHGAPDPNTMHARVDVRIDGQWYPLVLVPWTALGIEWADVLGELEEVRAQWDTGTQPGGPFDTGP